MINAPLIALAGFGSLLLLDHKNYRSRLRRMAVAYIKHKYGFNAKAGAVHVMSIGWLEPKWHKGKSAYVVMSYKDTTFHVRASLLARMDECSDTYQMAEFTECILAPIRAALDCEELCATVQYGARDYGGCYLGTTVTSFEDLVSSIGHIEVTVSAHGIDESRIARLDLSYLGANPRIGIYEWEDSGVVKAAYTPASLIQPSDGDTICLRDHFFYAEGAWKHRGYRRFHGTGVTFAFETGIGIEVAPFDMEATTAEDETALSPWYRLSASGKQQTRVIVFPHETSPDVKMRIQLYETQTNEFSHGLESIPFYGDDASQSPFTPQWPYHAAVWLNLTYKNGAIDRAPQVVRVIR